MTRLLLPLALVLSASVQTAALACPVIEPDALVDTGLSSIRTPLEVSYYGGDEGDGSGGFCTAFLRLDLSALASRSLVPRPRELAEELVPVAKAYGAKTCEIAVWVNDDLHPEVDARADPDACRLAEFRYDGGSWWPLGDERPCWEEE